MKVLVDMDGRVYKEVKSPHIESGYNANDCYDAIRKGIPIYDNATNGDVVKMLFPNADIEEYFDGIPCLYTVTTELPSGHKQFVTYPLDWWNAPYERSK